MEMKKLVFLGGGTDILMDRAKSYGFTIALIQKKESLTKLALALADRLLVCDYEKEEEFDFILEFVRSVNADYCIAVSESALRAGARINDLISGTCGNRESCETLKDKLLMRE